MKVSILAIADKPGPESFGLTTFVADVGLSDHFFCVGLSASSKHRRLVPKESLELYFPYHMHDVRRLSISVEVDPDNSESCAVAWIGNEFRTKSVELELPLPREVANTYTLPTGIFWFDTPKRILALQREYIEYAMREVCRTKDPRVAEIMSQTLPSEPETLAALWYTGRLKYERPATWFGKVRKLLGVKTQAEKDAARAILKHREIIANYSSGIFARLDCSYCNNHPPKG